MNPPKPNALFVETRSSGIWLSVTASPCKTGGGIEECQAMLAQSFLGLGGSGGGGTKGVGQNESTRNWTAGDSPSFFICQGSIWGCGWTQV